MSLMGRMDSGLYGNVRGKDRTRRYPLQPDGGSNGCCCSVQTWVAQTEEACFESKLSPVEISESLILVGVIRFCPVSILLKVFPIHLIP